MALTFRASDKTRLLGVFGDDATVNGQAVRGVFSNGYAETLDAEGTAPSLLCLAEQVPSVAHGQAVVVAGQSFTGQVVSVQPDGYGWLLLLLHRSV
jgi:hypothetical protein